MIRSFLNKKISEKDERRIIENIFRGPSAGFSQGVDILVLKGDERESVYELWGEKAKRRAEYPLSEGIEKAPLVIVFLVSKKRYEDRYMRSDKNKYVADNSWPAPFWFIDAGMSVLLGILSSVDAGLGALFTGIKNAEKLHAKFGIPSSYTSVGILSIGYADPNYRSYNRVKRRELADCTHYGRW